MDCISKQRGERLQKQRKAFNAAIEHADGLGESTETANTKEVELEGCSRGMDKQACVDKVGGNAGHGTGPADMSNELTEFVTLLIELEDLGSGDIPCIRLGGTQMQTGDANGSRGQTDWSDDQTDEPRGQTYVPNQSNNAEMAGISHGDGAGTYLGAGDVKCGVKVTNGIGSQTDMSIGHGDVPSVETDPNKPTKAPENVSITRKKDKPPNLPMEAARRRSNKLNTCRDQTDMPIARTDMHTVGDKTKTAENETEIISMQQNSLKTRDLLYTPENETPKSICRRRRVSAGNGDVHLPWNVPVGVLGRMFAFGQPESRGEAIVLRDVEGETAEGAGNGGGDQDGDRDGMTSGSSIDSSRVKAVRLAGESQHMRWSRRNRTKYSPGLSRSPI